ncbi:hypothetical protein MLD38_021418 [Melastoma candidum]|uniref:Uncharacterized protein n=1 Tax=Melastoma candidum TaxID=119954 RepID=A0ACB9QJW6_9MYRT|nr:hypothetical protein MLD38_021418 [Melastoma candidum]
MVDSAKHFPSGPSAGSGGVVGVRLSLMSEFRSVLHNRLAVALAYASMFAFVVFTVFLVLCPSSSDSSHPFLTNVFYPSSAGEDSSSFRSRVSSLFSHFFPSNSTGPLDSSPVPNSTVFVPSNRTDGPPVLSPHRTSESSSPSGNASLPGNSNSTRVATTAETDPVSNQSMEGNLAGNSSNAETLARNVSGSVVAAGWVSPERDFTLGSEKKNNHTPGIGAEGVVDKQNETHWKEQGAANGVPGGLGKKDPTNDPLELLRNCNFFDGKWVRDDLYPLYQPGSCSLIDEQFNCILNGRPDKDYQKLKWKPKDSELPRLDGARML